MTDMDWPPEAREIARRELVTVLREIRALLARPDNDFTWSSWEDERAALGEVDYLVRRIDSGRLPPRSDVSILLAPTGPLQETALASGWGDEFLDLASRCDGALAIVYATPSA